ncbi:Hypothetical predicted protein [Paramuricea clavata]|uniref:Uncharacterized protein n=1 Tax=Paramuricea clavata TaxID=317549 RepID=A0A6S7K1I2_PARCT|nr:Hypothetical predicted protein [Paramuricea clavata]
MNSRRVVGDADSDETTGSDEFILCENDGMSMESGNSADESKMDELNETGSSNQGESNVRSGGRGRGRGRGRSCGRGHGNSRGRGQNRGQNLAPEEDSDQIESCQS